MTNVKKDNPDGLEDVVLKKKWAGSKIGSTVRVDPVRAKWLIDHGFGDSAKAITKKRST